MFPKAWRKQLTFAFERKEQRGASLRPRHGFGQRLSRAARIDQSWAIISSPSSCISRIFLCAPQILGVVPITNRRLFVYCVQIVFEKRLPRAASTVHFALIIERSIYIKNLGKNVIISKVLCDYIFHSARIFMRAVDLVVSCARHFRCLVSWFIMFLGAAYIQHPILIDIDP